MLGGNLRLDNSFGMCVSTIQKIFSLAFKYLLKCQTYELFSLHWKYFITI